MASQIRSDLWSAAFVRRHNDLGRLCVVARRGDPSAGQIFIEVDHLNGTASLYTPAPASVREDDDPDKVFQCRFERVASDKIRERIEREADFDPDLWVLALEMRTGDVGVTVVTS